MEGRIKQVTLYENNKNVLYLSQRDHRVVDNYSLNFAIDTSHSKERFLYVGTVLKQIKMNEKQRGFIVTGLCYLEKEYQKLNIDFVLIEDFKEFVLNHNIDCIITEFSPLRESLDFHDKIMKFSKLNKITFYICDSHNLVPCVVLESYTRTPKSVKSRLYKQWTKYFKPVPLPEIQRYNQPEINKTGHNYKPQELQIAKNSLKDKFQGGTQNGLLALANFIKYNLKHYESKRNKPSEECVSGLSPWIHSGHLGIITIIQKIYESCPKDDPNVLSFIDELFGWKQIAEHFCYFEINYDNLNGALPWAKQTLQAHQSDKREKIYTLSELELAQTNDDEWNAGQKELVVTGKMHGYVRMYWAKKLLYWTESPESAIELAIYLNDKYSLDGNDPNGYLGIMWSICGTMDQGWKETNIRGKIRGMNGIKDKIYTKKWLGVKI